MDAYEGLKLRIFVATLRNRFGEMFGERRTADPMELYLAFKGQAIRRASNEVEDL